MSNLAQFFGGAVPIGGVIPMWGVGINPTISGMEYLRSGSVKAVAGYESTAVACPGLAHSVVTQASNTAINTNASRTVRFAGSHYYVMGTGGSATGPFAATSLTATWGAVTVDAHGHCDDAFTFNAYCWHLANQVGTIYRLSGTTGLAVTVTAVTPYYCGAVNAAQNLGVILATSEAVGGRIFTSTTGATWTSRTPSGGDANALYFAVWQPVGPSFAYVNAAGVMFTTTDGFTLTNRGTPSGVTNPQGTFQSGGNTVGAASSYSAANSNATLFSYRCTFNSIINQNVLVRSANGTTFTASLWSSLLGFTPTATPRVFENAGVFYAYVPSSSMRTVDDPWLFQSTDGVTWTQIAKPMNAANNIANGIQEIRYLNGLFFILPTGSQTVPSYSLTSLATTHIGVPLASNEVTASNATVTNYVRIK
jgi:hypothetical protein